MQLAIRSRTSLRGFGQNPRALPPILHASHTRRPSARGGHGFACSRRQPNTTPPVRHGHPNTTQGQPDATVDHGTHPRASRAQTGARGPHGAQHLFSHRQRVPNSKHQKPFSKHQTRLAPTEPLAKLTTVCFFYGLTEWSLHLLGLSYVTDRSRGCACSREIARDMF